MYMCMCVHRVDLSGSSSTLHSYALIMYAYNKMSVLLCCVCQTPTAFPKSW